VRFALVGVLGFVVDAGVLSLLIGYGITGPYLGRAISFLLAVTTTWFVNRRISFQSRGSPGPELARFALANSAGGVLNYFAYWLAIHWLGADGMTPTIGVATGALAGLIVNYTLSKRFVFARFSSGGAGA
jgi:putative flippase GtrA